MNTLHIRGEPDFSFDIYFPVWGGGGNKVPECEFGTEIWQNWKCYIGNNMTTKKHIFNSNLTDLLKISQEKQL